MTTRHSRMFYAATLLVVLNVHFITPPARAVGTWVPLVNQAPANVSLMILLSDGTILAKHDDNNYNYADWFRLSPDIHGSYVNGTWSTNVPAMHDTRYAFASDVLQDGRVLVAGGEYGSGWSTSEIYDPVANIWANAPVPTNLLNPELISPQATSDVQGFSDAPSMTLADGRVLIAPNGANSYGQTMLFDPKNNTWSDGPKTVWQDFPQLNEMSWLKLPDDSILTTDGGTTTTERYIPKSNTWIADANVPVLILDPYNEEGPALMLPNGKGIFFGATSHTAIYTPSGSTSPGSWVAGPDFPNDEGMPDAPAAMMVNGKILLATSPTATDDNRAPSPTSFYEYDYQSGPVGAFTRINAPGGGLTIDTWSQSFVMLVLPDGTVLLSNNNGSQLYVYQPDGSPLSAGKPSISTIATNSDGSLHLTGTKFNGISLGSAFGDENQNDSNYPLVRFTDASGNIRYGRTYNWSSSGVQTGNAVVSTECAVPAGASLQDTIQVVANGIASDAVWLTNFPVVTTVNDSGPGSLRQAAASSSPRRLITFASGLSGQTITLTSGQIVLSTNVTIDSSTLTNGIAINGNASSRIFQVNSGANVVLNALTLTNGNAQGSFGGAIQNTGNLTLNQCLVISNVAAFGAGGVYNSGILTVNASTFAKNSSASPYYGGGIANDGTLTVNQSTFSGNSAYSGGAIYSDGLITVNQSTLSSNVAFCCGGGISLYASPGAAALINSIVAGNSPDDLYLPFIGFTSLSNNLTGTNPQLAPLGNYAGATPTMPPLTGSPAIDGGSDAAASGFATDQRGYSRLSGVHVDIGAVEFQTSEVVTLPASGVNTTSAMLNGTVNPGDDATAYYFQYGLTTNYGSVTATNFLPATNFTYTAASGLSGLSPGTLYHFQLVTANSAGTKAGADLTFHTFRATSVVLNTSDAGDGSLREAIANTLPGGSISFAANLSGSTIALTNGQITISNNVTIDASVLANGISISGNSTSGIFHVNYGVNVVLNALTLTNGNNSGAGWSGYGGAINNSGTLAMNNCTLAGNSVASSKLGGAIDNNNGGMLTLTGCTLYGNSGDYGGAINNRDTSVCSLRNTTLYGNAATAAAGGAIYNSYSANLSILQCTISGNSAVGVGKGIFNLFSQLTFTNTIIAGNTGGDIYNYSGSTITAGGSNIVQLLNGAGTTMGTSTILAANPLLGSLANNGGPTLTLLPQSGSPAINAGVSSAAASLTTDQRGLPRLSGSAVDIGAVEIQFITPSAFTGAEPGQGLDLQGSFLYAVNVGDNGAPGLIGDANFTADNISGVTITTPGSALNTINNWASPNFGATTNGLRLAQVMSSIRWTGAPGTFTVNLSGLQVGASYRLQMLFIESLSDRVFNVTVNGYTIVPNFRLLDYGPQGTAIVIPYDFTATSTNALIQLGGGAGGNDNNPLLSGFTLETLASITTPFKIIQLTKLGNGTFQFSFTNLTGASFQIFAATNVAQTTANWTMIGFATESPAGSGQFQFTDSQATNYPQRFYRVKSP